MIPPFLIASVSSASGENCNPNSESGNCRKAQWTFLRSFTLSAAVRPPARRGGCPEDRSESRTARGLAPVLSPGPVTTAARRREARAPARCGASRIRAWRYSRVVLHRWIGVAVAWSRSSPTPSKAVVVRGLCVPRAAAAASPPLFHYSGADSRCQDLHWFKPSTTEAPSLAQVTMLREES
jgi:hypothetical protein